MKTLKQSYQTILEICQKAMDYPSLEEREDYIKNDMAFWRTKIDIENQYELLLYYLCLQGSVELDDIAQATIELHDTPFIDVDTMACAINMWLNENGLKPGDVSIGIYCEKGRMRMSALSIYWLRLRDKNCHNADELISCFS